MKMADIARVTYQKIPFYFRWPLYPIKLIYRFLHRLVHKFRIDTWILSEKDTLETSFTVLFAGHERSKNYIAHLAFDGFYSEIHIGKRWVWDLFMMNSKKSRDNSLIILEVNKAFWRLFSSRRSFFIPCWIGGEVDLSATTSLLSKDHTLRNNVRKMKKFNLQFEVTKELHEFHNFYRNMYLPYITRVHGNRAFPDTYEEMEKKCHNCELLLVKEENEYIAGQLIHYESKTEVPYLWQFGVKEGNIDYLKVGAKGAADYFSMMYLEQKGYKKVHLGGTRAFLKDGVLQYKKKWGMRIIGSTEKGFLMKPLSKSREVKGFFLRNPFICLDGDRLNGVIFLENSQLRSKEDFEKIYRDYYLKGLSKLNIYLFGDEENTREIIPAELFDKTSVYSAERLFQK